MGHQNKTILGSRLICGLFALLEQKVLSIYTLNQKEKQGSI